MQLLYAGAFSSHAGYGAEVFMNRGFRSEGHRTHCVDYRAQRFHLYRELRKAPPCDAFFLQRGDGFPVALLKALATPKFFWDTETPGKVADHASVLRSGQFDHLFFWSQEFIDQFSDLGWISRDRASVIGGACDPGFHRLLPAVQQDIDVLFLGRVTGRRGEVLARVAQHFDLRVHTAFGEEMVQLFNRAKIVLNIHADHYRIVPSRVYEVMGCGAFLLTESLSSESPFRSGVHLAEFDTIEALVEKARHYLAHDVERAGIAEHGRQAVLANHTYAHRAREVVDVMLRHGVAAPPQPVVRATWRAQLYRATEPLKHATDWLTVRANAVKRRARVPRAAS